MYVCDDGVVVSDTSATMFFMCDDPNAFTCQLHGTKMHTCKYT